MTGGNSFCDTRPRLGNCNITRLEPQKEIEIEVWNSYETNAYVAAYGPSGQTKSYFYLGVLEGILQLLYVGEIDKNEIYLDSKTYNSLFSEGPAFEATQIESRVTGGTKDKILLRRVR